MYKSQIIIIIDTIQEHPTGEPPMFHLLVQLLHPHKLEVLSFKNFVVKIFADTADFKYKFNTK